MSVDVSELDMVMILIYSTFKPDAPSNSFQLDDFVLLE